MTQNAQPQNPASSHASTGVRFDGTVNLPTILSVIVMFASSIGFGFGVYSNLDTRITKNSTDIIYVQRDFEALRANQRDMNSRVSDELNALRQQNREDFADVRQILNQLLLSSGTKANDGRVWQK